MQLKNLHVFISVEQEQKGLSPLHSPSLSSVKQYSNSIPILRTFFNMLFQYFISSFGSGWNLGPEANLHVFSFALPPHKNLSS